MYFKLTIFVILSISVSTQQTNQQLTLQSENSYLKKMLLKQQGLDRHNHSSHENHRHTAHTLMDQTEKRIIQDSDSHKNHNHTTHDVHHTEDIDFHTQHTDAEQLNMANLRESNQQEEMMVFMKKPDHTNMDRLQHIEEDLHHMLDDIELTKSSIQNSNWRLYHKNLQVEPKIEPFVQEQAIEKRVSTSRNCDINKNSITVFDKENGKKTNTNNKDYCVCDMVVMNNNVYENRTVYQSQYCNRQNPEDSNSINTGSWMKIGQISAIVNEQTSTSNNVSVRETVQVQNINKNGPCTQTNNEINSAKEFQMSNGPSFNPETNAAGEYCRCDIVRKNQGIYQAQWCTLRDPENELEDKGDWKLIAGTRSQPLPAIVDEKIIVQPKKCSNNINENTIMEYNTQTEYCRCDTTRHPNGIIYQAQYCTKTDPTQENSGAWKSIGGSLIIRSVGTFLKPFRFVLNRKFAANSYILYNGSTYKSLRETMANPELEGDDYQLVSRRANGTVFFINRYYTTGTIVLYNSIEYRALKNSKGQVPPTNTIYWERVCTTVGTLSSPVQFSRSVFYCQMSYIQYNGQRFQVLNKVINRTPTDDGRYYNQIAIRVGTSQSPVQYQNGYKYQIGSYVLYMGQKYRTLVETSSSPANNNGSYMLINDLPAIVEESTVSVLPFQPVQPVQNIQCTQTNAEINQAQEFQMSKGQSLMAKNHAGEYCRCAIVRKNQGIYQAQWCTLRDPENELEDKGDWKLIAGTRSQPLTAIVNQNNTVQTQQTQSVSVMVGTLQSPVIYSQQVTYSRGSYVLYNRYTFQVIREVRGMTPQDDGIYYRQIKPVVTSNQVNTNQVNMVDNVLCPKGIQNMGQWRKDGGNKEKEYCACAGVIYQNKDTGIMEPWVSKWCNIDTPNGESWKRLN